MMVRLFSRDAVAKSPCTCGSLPGIYKKTFLSKIRVVWHFPILLQSLGCQTREMANEPPHFRDFSHENAAAHYSIRTGGTIQPEKYALANIKWFPEQNEA